MNMETDSHHSLPINSSNASASFSLADICSASASSPFPHDDPRSEKADGDADTPVEKELHGDSAATEFTGLFCGYRRLIIFLSLFLLASIVIIAVSVTGWDKTRTEASGSSNQRADNPRRDLDSIILYLVTQDVSEGDDLMRVGSPQNRAANWLVFDDERRLSLPSGTIQSNDGYQFMARYVMALLYFAMSGENWHFKLEFLSRNHICAWQGPKMQYNTNLRLEYGGVGCTDEGIPFVIDLGKHT